MVESWKIILAPTIFKNLIPRLGQSLARLPLQHSYPLSTLLTVRLPLDNVCATSLRVTNILRATRSLCLQASRQITRDEDNEAKNELPFRERALDHPCCRILASTIQRKGPCEEMLENSFAQRNMKRSTLLGWHYFKPIWWETLR